ncbi:alpha/beta fold hydrolase [Mangrovimonas xylaniphaga]|uniref:alpha/beta fold hydrolase n=1 Tax=Mangrovimonas xylaniphaga TaxID=1645915 RepID=UPI0006B51DA6|nr:alpha/beta hydrolase [Mangrovimonas xylaniphaga]
MKIRTLLWLFAVGILTIQCQKNYNDYAEFKAKPSYILQMNEEQRPYFEAYDKALKLWGTNYEELYVPTSFGMAHVIVSGPKNGEPIVLLHGMNASATSWYPNAKALSKNHRVFAIDLLIEPGKSDLMGEVKDIESIVSWYFEIFQKLQLEKFNIIGASRGGWLSVKIALHEQTKIKKMILLSPAQTFKWIQPSTGLLANIIYALSPEKKRLENVLESMSANVKKIDQTYIDQYFLGSQLDSINRFVVDMKPYSKEELHSLGMPILVLIGDDDLINNEKSLEVAKENIPNIDAEIIPNAGHFLSIDQAEMVNTKILEFLDSGSEDK